MKDEIVIYIEDSPKRPGYAPKEGDQGFTLRFPTHDGKELVVECGPRTIEILGTMFIDHWANTPSYGDGSTNIG